MTLPATRNIDVAALREACAKSVAGAIFSGGQVAELLDEIERLRALLRGAVECTTETMSAPCDDHGIPNGPWSCDCGAVAINVTNDAHEAEIAHHETCWIGKARAALGDAEPTAKETP